MKYAVALLISNAKASWDIFPQIGHEIDRFEKNLEKTATQVEKQVDEFVDSVNWTDVQNDVDAQFDSLMDYMNPFDDEPKTIVPLAPKTKVTYLGCYCDYNCSQEKISKKNLAQQGKRDLPVQLTKGMSHLKPKECLKLAKDKGFKYAGLQYGGECWAGHHAPQRMKVPESQCNKKCSMDNTMTCGQADRNSVWALTDESKTIAREGEKLSCGKDEALNLLGPNKCKQHSECDGKRQCSGAGWCSGKSGCTKDVPVAIVHAADNGCKGETKNILGSSKCAHDYECDGIRTCSSAGWCQGKSGCAKDEAIDHPVDNGCKGETHNVLGKSKCAHNYECDGKRTCSAYGWCQGKSGCAKDAAIEHPADNGCKGETNNLLGKSKCAHDYECDGKRTCSQWGWCNGKSGCAKDAVPTPKPVIKPVPTPSPKQEDDILDIWWKQMSKMLEEPEELPHHEYHHFEFPSHQEWNHQDWKPEHHWEPEHHEWNHHDWQPEHHWEPEHREHHHWEPEHHHEHHWEPEHRDHHEHHWEPEHRDHHHWEPEHHERNHHEWQPDFQMEDFFFGDDDFFMPDWEHKQRRNHHGQHQQEEFEIDFDNFDFLDLFKE